MPFAEVNHHLFLHRRVIRLLLTLFDHKIAIAHTLCQNSTVLIVVELLGHLHRFIETFQNLKHKLNSKWLLETNRIVLGLKRLGNLFATGWGFLKLASENSLKRCYK
jgi:hypothetical protein